MQRLRYDLKLLFVAMSNVGVLAWATVAMSSNGNLLAFPLVAVVASFSVAWYGITKGGEPLALGALAGFASVPIFTICFFASQGISYFFGSDEVNYFEDGTFTELVISLPYTIVVGGSIGIAIGIACGAIVWGLQTLLAIIKR